MKSVLVASLLSMAIGSGAFAAAPVSCDQLLKSGETAFSQRNYAQAEKNLKQALAMATTSKNANQIFKANHDLAWLYISQGRYMQARPHLEKVLSFAEKSKDSDVVQKGIEAVDALAYISTQQGRYREAESHYARLAGAGLQFRQLNSILRADAQLGRARVLALEGRFAESRQLLQDTAKLVTSMQATEIPKAENVSLQNKQALIQYIQDAIIAAVVKALGAVESMKLGVAQADLLLAEGNLNAADARYRKSIADVQTILKKRDDVPGMAPAYIGMGKVALAQGKLSDADIDFTKAKKLVESACSATRPLSDVCDLNLAQIAIQRGQLDTAQSILEKIKTSIAMNLGPDSLPAADVSLKMGELYRAKGDLAKSEEAYRQSLAVQEKLLGKDNPALGPTLNGLAGLMAAQGKSADAEQLYSSTVLSHEKQSLSGNVESCIAMIGKADLLVKKGDQAAAEPLYRNALGTLEKSLIPSDPRLMEVYANLSDIMLAQNKYPEAESLLRRRVAGFERAGKTSDGKYLVALDRLALSEVSQEKWTDADNVLNRLVGLVEAGKSPTTDFQCLPKYPNVLAKLQRTSDAERMQSRLKALNLDEKPSGENSAEQK